MLQINTVSSFTLSETYISLQKVYPLDEFINLIRCQKRHISYLDGCLIIQIRCNTNIFYEVHNFFYHLICIRI